ncbi:hypothetical protein [uncultured Sneathia sp.]|uniref:hypothetical protein n=1 Tax=uncultured Sneathia sp. TaxID=278067 RepID=UPI0025974E21|nr:hypothetical protein [uncultured Sneathia sp.]
MEWHKLYFHKNNVVTCTDSGVLIKLPNKSSYQGYKFWFPRKLVKPVDNVYNCFIFTTEFKFKIFKNGKTGKAKYRVIDSEEIDVDDMMEIFSDSNFDCWNKVERESEKLEQLRNPTVPKIDDLIDDEV